MSVFEKVKAFAEKANSMEEVKSELSDWEIVFQIEVSDGEPCYMQVKDGKITAVEGKHENPDVTLTADSETWGKLLSGELDATEAYMAGQLQVEGDISEALRLKGIMDTVGST